MSEEPESKLRKRRKEPSSPLWMTTYGDMVTLLLTFFVLLFSFTSMDQKKFDQVAGSLRGALGIMHDRMPFQTPVPGAGSSGNLDLLRRNHIYESVESLRDKLSEYSAEGRITVEGTESGILIRMGDHMLFDPGKAELKPQALDILKTVGENIRDIASEVQVAGHTDKVPIHNDEFPSNWDLSAARALSVVHYLVDHVGVSPEILAAVGYGEYRPIASNKSEEGRQINRRVEFLVTWK